MLLAQRRDLPPGIRDALAADPDAKGGHVRRRAPAWPKAQLRAMVDRHGVRVVAGVAANPDAPPALLEGSRPSRSPVRKALRAVARHPDATSTALRECLSDEQARPGRRPPRPWRRSSSRSC
ncbi:hypothetical protein [Streptomyces sp. KL116D]|uniref:hypothetical protein n=1 Tax=Streptomyces sp. KL116D TaxID=3045152 RepID=UPI003556D835